MKRQLGATMVEFALVLMLFLTFLLGVLDLARMLWTWNAASEATRWGARVSVVCNKDAAAVLTAMKRFVPQIQAANVQIDWYTWNNVGNTFVLDAGCTPANCAGVNVRLVNLDYNWISPIGFSLPAAIPMPGFSTFLPREIMGQDPNSASVCS